HRSWGQRKRAARAAHARALDRPPGAPSLARARGAREAATRGAARGSGRRRGSGGHRKRAGRAAPEHWTGPPEFGGKAEAVRPPRLRRRDRFARYDGSGSDFLSGTISEGDSSSRLASINARRIFSITVISVFIAIRLSRVPAHCSSLLESPFERAATCRAVFRMASEAIFRWTASSVKVSRSMIMVSGPLTGPVSETGAMIRRVPPGAGTPASCRAAAPAAAPVPRDASFV